MYIVVLALSYIYTSLDEKVPVRNLKYTIEDLQDIVKDSLQTFSNDVLKDEKVIDSVLLLLMVVNSREFLAAMYYFNKNKAKVFSCSNNLYYIGKWGEIPAALVQQRQQGIGSPDEAQEVARSSINLFKNLKAIVALGVCGTMGRLGDVIVSSRIDGCNLYKMKGVNYINRGTKGRPGKNICNFFMTGANTWSFQCTKPNTKEYKAVAALKPMLSGCPLIASGEYRDKLIASVSKEAGGVEMEGIGVVTAIEAATKRDSIEFIIVKAGCDYADESKNKEWQPVAAMAAADFVYSQLNTRIALEWFLGKLE